MPLLSTLLLSGDAAKGNQRDLSNWCTADPNSPAFAGYWDEVTARKGWDKTGPRDGRGRRDRGEIERDTALDQYLKGLVARPPDPAASVPAPSGFQRFLDGMDRQIVGGGEGRPQAFSGPVTTVPSGVQRVEVTNPPPAATVYVTVNATTNASAAEIGEAIGNRVGAALRSTYGDTE